MIVPTPEQQAVVTAPLAPLRVAAGAGTGKTTTIAARVVHLVSELGLEPERILGITFTNKAAGELADRIRQLLVHHYSSSASPEDRQVEVHTYHGFAAQLLREFGALVGVERRTPVITPTFSRQLLSQVVRTIELPHLDATYAGVVEDLRRLGSALGDHLLTPEQIEVPPHPPHGPWEVRADLLKGLREYQGLKRRLGVTDYADLVVMAHRLVTEFPEVAREVASRYQSVMLDEYQDTNPGQRELLRALFGGGFPVMAVGDVDQTIYEWRGASPHNFDRFPSHFPTPAGQPSPTLPLTTNRRSLPAIIAVANRVRAETGSGQPDLVALSGRIGGEVAVSWHDSAVAEAEWIARRLDQLHAHHRWRDMAVLFRKNKDMVLVHDALRAAGIPVEVANLGGLLGVPEVADLRAWLRILEDPSDEPALFRVLMGSRFRLGISDLHHLSLWVRQRDRQADQEHETVPRHLLLEAIDRVEELSALRAAARAALSRFRHQYRQLLRAAQGVTLVELCRRVLDLTGAWPDLAAMSEPEGLSARLNLFRFLDLTEAWSPLEGRPSLQAFLDYLAVMESEASEELDTARLSGEDAVTLLTVHRAKGLEWEVVFLPACYQNNFPSKSSGFENPYLSGKHLPYELRIDRVPPVTSEMSKKVADAVLREEHTRQEWRVAYVAVTRAKQRLFVSGAYWYGHPEPTSKPARSSPLWDLVAAHPACRVESKPGTFPERPSLLRLEVAASGPDPVFEQGWDGALRAQLSHPGWARAEAQRLGEEPAFATFHDELQQMLAGLPPERPPEADPVTVTSVTGLVNYATCPQAYFWSDVDRLPRRPNPAARRGTQIHRLIELHHRGQMAFEDLEADLYDLATGDEATHTPGDSYTGFLGSRFASEQPWLVEAPFEIGLGALRIRGRVDAVYRLDDAWEIVDFKSGRRPPPDPVLDQARLTQLEAYALAAGEGWLAPTRPQSMRVTFAYLGGGVEEVSHTADSGFLIQAQNHLETLANGIMQGDFPPRPGTACRDCDFLHVCPAGQGFLGSR